MFTEAFPILSTSDVGRALAFYRDLLGATVTYQFPPEGEPGYVALRIGDSHLGVTRQPPVDQPSGERMAIVTDPDGNRVIVGQRAPATA